MTTIKYKLTAPQSEIIASRASRIVVCAGRRFGKTWVSGSMMFEESTGETGRPKKTWFISPTNNQSRENMWRDWMAKYIPEQYYKRYEKEMYAKFYRTNSEVYLKSADDPEHLRGGGPDFVVFDEFRDMPAGTFDIVYPSTTDKGKDHKLLIISTPKGYDEFYKLAMKAKHLQESGNKNWAYFHYTSIEGGNIEEAEIEQSRSTMSPKMFAQEYLASFENMSNKIYDSFDNDRNANRQVDAFIREYPLPNEILVGIDFNVNPMTAAIAFSVPDSSLKEKIFFFDEVVDKNSSTQTLADILKKRFPNKKITVYPDPTGKKHQTSAIVGKSDFDILASNGFKVCSPYAPYQTRDKFNTVNASLYNARGETRVYISQNKCPNLVQSLNGYSYNEKGEPDKTSGLDHISDAMAYLICYRMPFLQKGKIYIPKVIGF
jgi:hypothetical protein